MDKLKWVIAIVLSFIFIVSLRPENPMHYLLAAVIFVYSVASIIFAYEIALLLYKLRS